MRDISAERAYWIIIVVMLATILYQPKKKVVEDMCEPRFNIAGIVVKEGSKR